MTAKGARTALVTGAAGMLGSELLRRAPPGWAAFGTDLRREAGVGAVGVDLAEPDQVRALFELHGPFAGVIHGAAWTAVDLAEERPEEARRANETACGVLAEACARADVPLVIVSTDFVFDGTARRPYREDDAPSPTSVYGRTKLAGELAARAAYPEGTRVVRTQWLYGPRGKHFPGTMLELARTRPELRVVDDQRGSPTSTLELAPALWDVLLSGEAGTWHAACEGEASWYDLAVATFELAGLTGVRVTPCTTDEFPRPAKRPAYSVLDCAKLARLRGRRLAPWRTALADHLRAERAATTP